MRRRDWIQYGCCVLALCTTACGDGPAEPNPGEAGIHFTVGGAVTDTIGARAALRVRVLDESGHPALGAIVRFEPVPVAYETFPDFLDYRVRVAPAGSEQYASFAVDTTDGSGEAEVNVRLGIRAGPTRLVLRVPSLGYVDSARYSITPGAVVGATVAPEDSAAFAGHGYRLLGHAVDRAGNARDDPVTYTVAYGPVSVDRDGGTITALSVGRAAVIANAQGKPDTAYVSVVPHGSIATQEFYPGNGGPIGIFFMQLDGSGRQRLGPGIDNDAILQGFGWSPDGRDLAIARGRFINLVSPGSAERPLVEMSGPVMTSARFSRDGLWVYFAHAGTQTQPGGIYRVRTDGTGLEHVGAQGNDILPSPSHDGRFVAYLSYRFCGTASCIRIIDLATKQDLTIGGRSYLAQGKALAWSPVEDLIAYHDGGSRVVLVRSDGSGERVLATSVFSVNWMDWSPDGRWLLVSAAGPVMLLDVQTGERLPLAPLASYGPTSWRP